ncbi:protein virilizer [Anopheles cruzii]|uniref:protein virilizer n=1 Tax=Anopheles cruzii TaxID=68878 RepID=UPI0022EC71A6|nr:protein virilizer [Anopheles cruzii]
MDDSELPELLFFDTFSHDTYERNLDLVQFPNPVYITEVRIIPLGARVHADFPGGVRLGATNPSNFHIELFVNDLGKPGAAVFESLGEFEYNQNNCIHLQSSARRIPTDGLVLKGWYTTMTLAVYGILTTSIVEPIVSPREMTPHPSDVNTLLIGGGHESGSIAEPLHGGCGGEWVQEGPSGMMVIVNPNEVFVQKEYPDDNSEDAPKDPRPYARRAAAAAAAAIAVSAASPPEPIYEPLESGKILPGPADCDLAPDKRSGKYPPLRSSDPVQQEQQYAYESVRSPRMRRHSNRDEFSRSPSLCKEYDSPPALAKQQAQHGPREPEWSRSPDYLEQPANQHLEQPPLPPLSRSRRLRSDSFDRLRREPSFERLEKEDRRRPRSPLDSPRRPRSPDRNESSPDGMDEEEVEDLEMLVDEEEDVEEEEGLRHSFHRGPPAVAAPMASGGKYGRDKRGGGMLMSGGPESRSPVKHTPSGGYGGGPRSNVSQGPQHQAHGHRHHHHQHQQYHHHYQQQQQQQQQQPPPQQHQHQHHHQHHHHHHHYQQQLQQQQQQALSSSGATTPPLPCEPVTITPVASPVITSNEEDTVSVTEQFEPILSDEEIPEDYDYDSECEFVSDYCKPFNPITTPLVRYERPDECSFGVIEQKMLASIEHLLAQERYGRKATENFLHESAEWRERFVDYAEQLVQHFSQLLQKYEARESFLHLLEQWIVDGWPGVETLINCIRIGLDFDRAMVQVQPAMKLRHMKAGIRLAEFVGPYECFMRAILQQDDFNLFDRFLGLYSQNFMALSIKLMIIRSMYACLDTQFALKYFLSASYNGYQILLDLLQENPSTRIAFALKSLLRKITLHETVELIGTTVPQLYEQQLKDANRAATGTPPLPVPETMELLHSLLTELAKAISLNEIVLSQPKRFLPVTAKFEIHKDLSSLTNVNRTIVQFFRTHRLLESLVMLLDLKATPGPLCETILNLVAILLSSLPKLRYLVERAPISNLLHKWLFQQLPLPTESHPGSHNAPSYELVHSELTRAQLLGLELAYKLQTMYHLDALASFRCVPADRERDRDRLAECLQALYQLAQGIGRRYVVEVLCMEGNMATLLELLEREKRQLAKDEVGSPGSGGKHKSPIVSYCVDMIDLAVRNADGAGYLAHHGHALLSLVKQHDQFEGSVGAALQELAIYLKPLELHDLFSYVDIGPLVELMKRSVEYVTAFPGDLITALRLVQFLAIPQYDLYEQPYGHAEFKYKYTLLQFYSADGQALLLSVLEKLNLYFDQPAIHASSLASTQGVLLTQILCPTVHILRKLVSYLIECRNTEFRDLTPIEPLLRTYALMQSVPVTAAAAADARQVQREIVRVLVAYTQPAPAEGLDTNNIHRSLWTQMIGELTNFTRHGPNYFLPGLLVLCELLPLPLPLYCHEELSPAEVCQLIKERQLWSAHLHPQSPAIGELIQTICTSSYTPLLVVLSRACLQLADLAPNMTLLISKSIADLIVNEPLLHGGLASTSHARLLSFLAGLVCHPSVKVSLLSILPGRIMDMMVGVLLKPGQTPAHQQTQEHIYVVFQSLFDAEIALMFGDGIDPARQLACSLPPKEIIDTFGAVCAECVTCPEIGVTVLMAALRTMLLLTENDTTFVTLVANLLRRREAWNVVVCKFLHKAKSNPEPFRVLFGLLSEFWRALTEVDNSIIIQGLNLPKRTVTLSIGQLVQLLPLPDRGEVDERRAALVLLEDLIVLFQSKPPGSPSSGSAANGTSTGKILTDNLSMLHGQLSTAVVAGGAAVAAASPSSASGIGSSSSTILTENLSILHGQLSAAAGGAATTAAAAAAAAAAESDEPPPSPETDWGAVTVDPLPQAEGIVTQYGSRSVYVVSDDCAEHHKLCDWLGFTPGEDDLGREQIPCDLQDLAKTCLAGDTNLTADCKRLLHLSASPHSNRDRLTTAPCFRTRRVEVEPSTGRPEKKIFATPLRGRCFSRAPTTRGDLFRSRPPNTSRPPSLHVDDFLALETCGAQPTGPTGYNKLSRDIITIRGSNRSRGGRNYPERGSRPGGGGGGGGGSSGGGGGGGPGGHWHSNTSGSGGGGSGGGGSGGSGGGGSGSGWSSSNASQMHDAGGGGVSSAGKHFGGGGSGVIVSGGHYRESNHFGAQRSRSGRGFNRYSSRLYSRPI